jgi:hypothetical protein
MEICKVVLFFCLCTNVSYTSGASSRSSENPLCAPDGFYCIVTDNCLPRTDRCTQSDSSPQCLQKTYEHCEYNAANDRFKVFKHSTPLLTSRGIVGDTIEGLKCLYNYAKGELKVEHQFITYRGFLYEFGTYGTRIQDPSGPNYEYRTREASPPEEVGDSSCTYDSVVNFNRLWENYKLCSNNCQNYAKGLGQYLIGDCTMPTRKRNAARSDEERDRQMAEYIFKLAGDGTCSNFTLPLPNSAGVRLAPTLFTILSTFMVVGWCF